ncbi:MAG: PAS domain-containing sensor histidine kinase [Hyphomicrobiales bacterium]|nr:PAS domain-containing sensor histidine kinase [Hyphomicrobiales bacterium]
MSVISVIEQRLTELVIAQAPATAVERARLKTFVAVRLGFTAFVLVATPLWLLAVSTPPVWQCLGFAALLAPLLAVVLLSRGAGLDCAQYVSVAGLLGFAASIAIGGADYSALAFAVILLAVLEAAASGIPRLLVIVGALAAVGAAALALNGAVFHAHGVSQIATACLLAAIVGYASALGSAMAHTNAVATLGERRETLRHEALAQTIGDLVVRQDRDGSVVHASNEALALFGLAPRELMGRGLFDRIHVGDRPTFLSAIADALDGETTVACVVRLRRGVMNESASNLAEPNFAWIEIRIHRLPHERRAGDPQDRAAVVSIVRDVTRSRQVEEEILAARERAEQANVWKDRFLANVTHELRTPLNAIIGFAEILMNEDMVPTDAARRREYAQIIHTSGHHLLEVVTSILDVSKIDAGSFDIVTEPFSLPPLLDQCCDMMSLRANKGGVELRRDYAREMDELVADKRACKQIIINLMSNAVKFTPRGGAVTLSARPEGNSFVISVSDTGIGISAGDLEHIGAPFFQAHNTTTRAYEGTGLGLSLVRGLVGLHGGSITVESALEQGTTVTVRLPAQCSAQGSKLAQIETIARRGSAQNFQVHEQAPVRKIA